MEKIVFFSTKCETRKTFWMINQTGYIPKNTFGKKWRMCRMFWIIPANFSKAFPWFQLFKFCTLFCKPYQQFPSDFKKVKATKKAQKNKWSKQKKVKKAWIWIVCITSGAIWQAKSNNRYKLWNQGWNCVGWIKK